MISIKKLVKKLRGEPDLNQLMKQGLKIGKGFSYGRYCFFDPSCCFLIQIGDNVTFSTRVHLLAHDASTKKLIGYSKVGKVLIGDGCFIGANVTVLPGVSIGEESIIGAGSVVTKDVPAREVWAGNPARKLTDIEEYSKKIKAQNYKRFGGNYKIGCGITNEMKQEMLEALDNSKYILLE